MTDVKTIGFKAMRILFCKAGLRSAMIAIATATVFAAAAIPALPLQLKTADTSQDSPTDQGAQNAMLFQGSDVGQKIAAAARNCAVCTVDVPKGRYTLAVNTTTPESIVLKFEPGAIVTVPSGVKWTIKSEISAGLHQAFNVLDGGSLEIAKGSVQPEWFGAKADGLNDDTDALRAAFAAIPQSGGVVHLGAGFYLVTGTVDIGSLGGGVQRGRRTLRGEGPRSVIACKPKETLVSCIRLMDSSVSSIADLTIKASANVTYALNITAVRSTEQVHVSDVSVFGGVDGIAIGPDTDRDVAEITMSGVGARQASNAGFLLGNGTSGNVLDITCTGCTSSDNNYGVEMNGANISWFGGATSANKEADFYLRQTNTDPITIESVRSEKSARFWYTASHATSDGNVSIRDVYVASFTASDGNVIYHLASMPILIENSTFRSQPAGISRFLVQNTEAHPTQFTMINVTTDNAAMPDILEKMSRDPRLVLFSAGDSIRSTAGITPGSGKVFVHGKVALGGG